MTTKVGKDILVDTNILVYLTTPKSRFHRPARRMIDYLWQEQASLCTSQQVIREMVAVLSNRQSAYPTLPMGIILRQVTLIRSQYTLLQDDLQTMDTFLQLIQRFSVGGKDVHDANIVATMQAHGVDAILTHNVKDFRPYANANLIKLLPLMTFPPTL